MDPCSCKLCEQFKKECEEKAPPPIKHNQPSMYDLLVKSVFNEAKKRDEKTRLVQKKVLKENSKDADIKWLKIYEELCKKCSPQQLAKLQKAVKEGKDLLAKKMSDVNSIIEQKQSKESKSSVSLVNLSRRPFNCPVTTCGSQIGNTALLCHFLRDHRQEFSVQSQEITTGRRAVLVFDEEIFKFNENLCLGVLTYAGKSQCIKDRPAVVGLCRQNCFLPLKFSYLLNHLPILIMACKTSLTCVLEDRELAKELNNPKARIQQIIVIWLATIETSKTVSCTITAFNNEGISRSTIVAVRNLKRPQEPENFMSKESDYLMLSCGDIKQLTKNSNGDIKLEIFIHEFGE